MSGCLIWEWLYISIRSILARLLAESFPIFFLNFKSCCNIKQVKSVFCAVIYTFFTRVNGAEIYDNSESSFWIWSCWRNSVWVMLSVVVTLDTERLNTLSQIFSNCLWRSSCAFSMTHGADFLSKVLWKY